MQGKGGAKFEFAALALDHPNPFKNVVVSATGITAVDDNQAKKDHKYFILVCVNGNYYSSRRGVMGAGDPTISNN